ncbi:MAG TPA: TIGR03118 family protein [Kofleriaceae bacterium]|nr:TIGR03118 family protein [Kofleriaceae bacterium]
MRSSICLGLGILLLGAAPACGDDNTSDDTGGDDGGTGDGGTVATGYEETDLLSDVQDEAPKLDVNLQNPWGLAFGDDTVFWISNQASATATICDESGAAVGGGDVTVPQGPTGVVYNTDEEGFFIGSGTAAAGSEFIFATVGGGLFGWSPDADPTAAIQAVDASDVGASYTGLAQADSGSESLLYSADFHNAQVAVYDADFNPVDLGPDAFVDPDLPDGFAPFGIHNVDGQLFVTFAQQDENAEEEVEGPGLGYVSEFDSDGTFVRRVMSEGELNAPWGVAMAPDDFGDFSGALLVGNLGDGRITALDPDSGDVLGQLTDADGAPIAIEGLWAIAFGNGLDAGQTDELYFTAGIGDEAHGLFGRLTAL